MKRWNITRLWSRGVRETKRTGWCAIAVAACSASTLWLTATAASAQQGAAASRAAVALRGAVALPAGVTEDMLAPPPMPGFMMDGYARRLSTAEMAAEAERAAAGARRTQRQRAAPAQPPQQRGLVGVAKPPAALPDGHAARQAAPQGQ